MGFYQLNTEECKLEKTVYIIVDGWAISAYEWVRKDTRNILRGKLMIEVRFSCYIPRGKDAKCWGFQIYLQNRVEIDTRYILSQRFQLSLSCSSQSFKCRLVSIIIIIQFNSSAYPRQQKIYFITGIHWIIKIKLVPTLFV